MERDEHLHAAALDRYWDALLHDRAGERPSTSDPALIAVIDRLHGAGAMAPLFPQPEQSWRELRRTAPSAAQPAVSHHATTARELAQPASPRRLSSWRPTWTLAPLATVLLVVVLATAYLVFLQGRLQQRSRTTWLPASIAAALPTGYSEEILFAATFPADDLLAGEPEAVFYESTLQPGAALPYLTGMACFCAPESIASGVGAELIESGSYSVHLDAPFWVQRGGFAAKREEIPAGANAVLTAGDVAIFHDFGTGEIRNAGAEPVAVIGIVIVDRNDQRMEEPESAVEVSSGHLPGLPPEIRGEQLANTVPSDWEQFPPGPLEVTLRRVILPPGIELPPFDPLGLEAIRVESGAIAWGFLLPDETPRPGMLVERRAGTSAPFVSAPPGVLRALRTAGSGPAELLVLTIEPARGGLSLLAP
jgi:hypothetical protein